MSTTFRHVLLGLTALSLPLGLAACGSEPDNEAALARLDDNLTDPSQDPEMNAALSDQILVDPDLTGQSNGNALRSAPGAPSGAMPNGTYEGAAADGRAAASAQFGKAGMMSAPKPRAMTSDDECSSCGAAAPQPTTLGARAEAQSKGSCDAKVSYDMGWAERMPAEFPVYPRANLKEAAGVDGGKCNVRVVTFTTPVGMKDVVDYYYTKARRGGYTAEYLTRGDEHVLGGTRDSDDAAYVLFLNPVSGGRIEVDIVASHGS